MVINRTFRHVDSISSPCGPVMADRARIRVGFRLDTRKTADYAAYRTVMLLLLE